MFLIGRVALRIRALLRRGAIERDMQDEMREHLERATERLIARGMSPEEAQLAALREFGNVTVVQEEARDARGMRWVDSVRADLRFAVRSFGRNKLTVAIIVSVFALGIGANTALVTAIQSQFQRPAPVVPDDDALVRIWAEQRATRTASWRWRAFTYEEVREMAAHAETFTQVAAWLAHDVVLSLGDTIGPRGVTAHFVSPNYFSALGVALVAGPGFTLSEDVTDFSAVISFSWAERYGSPFNAVGQRILVNNVPVRIVGVAPPAFQGALRNMGRPVLWIPVSARADIARVPVSWLTSDAIMDVFGRTAPGVSYDQAAAVAQLVVAHTLPDSATRLGMARVGHALSLHDFPPGPATNEYILVFGALSIIGLLLLLVTCTNVSSLMVAAAVARRHEVAVRLSLGASRARILRQLLTEATLLAIAGAGAGLTVMWWLLTLLAGPGGTIDGNDVMPDAWTVGFTMLVAIGTGVVFGLSPALHATRAGVANALRDAGSGASRQSRLQRGFVVAQIALSMPLLLLLGATLSTVLAEYSPLHADVSEHVVRVTFRPLNQTGAPEHRREAVEALIPRIAVLAEVSAVAPEASWLTTRRFAYAVPAAGGREDTAHTTLVVEGAAPGWFGLLDVPILLGRDFVPGDTAGREWPVIIPDNLARGLWGAAHPIGRIFDSPADDDTITMSVVGVYDASRETTRGNDSLRVFTAHGKEWRRDALLVRTPGDAEAFLPELRRRIRNMAPGLPVAGMVTLGQVGRNERRATLILGALVGAGGALALLLASLGLYGVIALAVRQRTREIGIRIALGAKPVRVARMFLASGLRLGVIALVIGLPLSIAALKLFLSGAELLAPKIEVWTVGAAVALVLLSVAALATWLPARRAAAVDPASTLRVE